MLAAPQMGTKTIKELAVCLKYLYVTYSLSLTSRRYLTQFTPLQKVSEIEAEYFPPKEEVILQNESPTDLYILVSGAVVSKPNFNLTNYFLSSNKCPLLTLTWIGTHYLLQDLILYVDGQDQVSDAVIKCYMFSID